MTESEAGDPTSSATEAVGDSGTSGRVGNIGNPATHEHPAGTTPLRAAVPAGREPGFIGSTAQHAAPSADGDHQGSGTPGCRDRRDGEALVRRPGAGWALSGGCGVGRRSGLRVHDGVVAERAVSG